MDTPLQLRVPETAAGARLDLYLSGGAVELPGMSRVQLQRLIAAGAVQIDGVPARRRASRLRGGEWISIQVPPPAPLGLTPAAMALQILFEDSDLLVLVKPAGLLVHPGAGRPRVTLVHGLLAHCQDLSGIGGVRRPGIVHRLDADTSGALVVAKHDAAHQNLSAQFAARTVTKDYLAWVVGRPQPELGRISTFYGRHPVQRARFTGRLHGGRLARTDYQVLATAGGLSLLQVRLGTGRTHQIRVHLAEHGQPLVGDPLYGGRDWGRLTSPVLPAAQALLGQALHAQVLAFLHPRDGRPMRLVAPVPAALRHLSRAAGLPLGTLQGPEAGSMV